MNKHRLCLFALLFAGAAHAQIAPGDQGPVGKLLENPIAKALGVPGNPIPTGGVYSAPLKAGGTCWIHNKTSDSSWVIVFSIPQSSMAALGPITNHVTLTAPVLVLSATAGTSTAAHISALPAGLKTALNGVANGGTVTWDSGANLISNVTITTEIGKKLQAAPLSLLPTGGLSLTGTLGAAVLEQIGQGTIAAPTADWSIKLTMRTTSEWKPALLPMSATTVTFGLTRAATGGAAGTVTFDANLQGLTIKWPKYTTPSNAEATFSWSMSGADFSLSGSFRNALPRVENSPINVTAFGLFYRVVAQKPDFGFSVTFETTLPGKTTKQSFTSEARLNTVDGSFAFKAVLNTDWSEPFNLAGATLLAKTGMDFTISPATSGIGFGVTGNLKLDGKAYGVTICFDSAGTAVKAVGVSFTANTLSVPAQMALFGGMMKSVPGNEANTAAFTTWKADLDKLPLPVFTDAKLVLYTPGLTCSQPAFEGKPGMGAGLEGTMTLLGNQVGSAKNAFALNGDAKDGLLIDNSLNAFTFPNGVLSLGKSQIFVNAPFTLTGAPSSAMKVVGKASAGAANGIDLTVKFSANKALFDFKGSVMGIGSVKVNAESVGPSLAQMNDFTVSSDLTVDPTLGTSVTNAMKPLVTAAATARKATNNESVEKLKQARSDFTAIDNRIGSTLRSLENAVAGFVDGAGRCLASKDLIACANALKKLEDFKASADYGKWLVAKTHLTWAEGVYGSAQLAWDLWDKIEKASNTLTVSNVTLKGSLASQALTLTITGTLANKPMSASFTTRFGTGGTLGTAQEQTAFADNIETANSSNAPRPAVLWTRGAATATTLTASMVNGKLIVTAKVWMQEGMVVCKDGSKARPVGQVSLYLRRATPPPIDRKTAIAIANAKLNDRGGCETDIVKFNANDTCNDGAGCCDTRPNGFNLGVERGTFFLSAGYNGGVATCSEATDGFHESMSDEITVIVGRPDDTGELNPGDVKWGEWQPDANCAPGSYATNFSQRVEPKNAKGDDDTALNSVRLVCAKRDGSGPVTITSHEGWWGSWAQPATGCPAGTFINAVRIRNEAPHGGKKDDTASNDVNMKCSNGTELNAGNGTTWGEWSQYRECPVGSAVCGVSIKIEEKKGKGDDVAMTGLRLRCCAL